MLTSAEVGQQKEYNHDLASLLLPGCSSGPQSEPAAQEGPGGTSSAAAAQGIFTDVRGEFDSLVLGLFRSVSSADVFTRIHLSL